MPKDGQPRYRWNYYLVMGFKNPESRPKAVP
jgi:hypothetical protein